MSAVRRLQALAAAFLLLLPAGPAAIAQEPIPAYANARLDRVGAALAKDPLFVDPDLGPGLDRAGRDRVRKAIRSAALKIGTPVYVVVIPNLSDSESQGMDEAFLFALHERTGRDGVYLMANSRGSLEAEAFMAPRRVGGLSDDEGARPADSEHRFDGLAERLTARLDRYRDAPAVAPSAPNLYTRPDAFGQENRLRPEEAETSGPFLTGTLLAGPLAAVALYWLGRAGVALRRRGPRRSATLDRATPPHAHPGAPAEPSMRWLRRTGAKELEGLRRALPEAEANRGREFAVSAYDAAQILHDEAGEDDDRVLDLVGAVVLARQGSAALAEQRAVPPAPCFVNPLHGPHTMRKRVRLGGETPRRHPLCAACDAVPVSALSGRVLTVRKRPHYEIPGVWKDNAFGAEGQNMIPRVMEYLGVE